MLVKNRCKCKRRNGIFTYIYQKRPITCRYMYHINCISYMGIQWCWKPLHMLTQHKATPDVLNRSGHPSRSSEKLFNWLCTFGPWKWIFVPTSSRKFNPNVGKHSIHGAFRMCHSLYWPSSDLLDGGFAILCRPAILFWNSVLELCITYYIWIWMYTVYSDLRTLFLRYWIINNC